MSSRSVKGHKRDNRGIYFDWENLQKGFLYIHSFKKKTVHSKPFRGIQSVGVDFLRGTIFQWKKKQERGYLFSEKKNYKRIMALSS